MGPWDTAAHHLSLIPVVVKSVLNQCYGRRVHWLPACARSEAVELEKIRAFWSSQQSSNYCFELPGPCQVLYRDRLPFHDSPVRYLLFLSQVWCGSVRVCGAGGHTGL